MAPVWKRIAANGLGAAAVLGLIGLGYGELAALSLAAQTPDRVVPVETAATSEANPVGDALRYRVPAMMALWGFLLVAGGELVLARRRRLAPPVESKPDQAELLLEQLLREAEAKSRTTADNTPTPAPRPGKGDAAHGHPG